MDVCESEKVLGKHKTVETPRSRAPLALSEKSNAATINTRVTRTREVSSRYKSPTQVIPSSPRRCPSPNLTRTTTLASTSSSSSSSSSSHLLLLPKRALSAGRTRPSTPPSPPTSRPSTHVHDSSVDVMLSSRRGSGSRLQAADGLWPSTMRSLSVSFQSDSISIPVSKKEKPVSSASDRTLRPPSNVAHRPESPRLRKATPERKRSPLKGKNGGDQSENSKPGDVLSPRLIDQHRWPSRIGRKMSSCSLNRSVDFGNNRMGNASAPGIGLSSLRRLSSSEEASRPLQRASSDTVRQLPHVGSGRKGGDGKPFDECSLPVLRPQKSAPATPSEKAGLTFAGVRYQSYSVSGLHPSSPSKASMLSRGSSPYRSRPSTPPSRGVSPSRIRPTSLSTQSNNSISVLSFVADLKKGKKSAAYLENAHQLRLLYNRYLQWRFANARAEVVRNIQTAIVERTLYNVWNSTLSLWESVIRKRINLQQLKLELKLNSVLNDQMAYLDVWAVLERDHVDALSGAEQDLEASTLRLPLTGRATADIEHLKVVMYQAVDVMKAMGSAICSLLSRVEGLNSLISEVAVVVAQEKAMLDESEVILASVAAMQAEESSIRTHLMQLKQTSGRSK